MDLSGTALGYLKKGEAITGENLQAGDVLIGLPSSGIHSNGYSLVRKIMAHSGLQYTDVAPFDSTSSTREIMQFNTSNNSITLGEIFLNPTRIYCDPVVDLIKAAQAEDSGFSVADIRGICHVTGGGLSNLLRLHDNLGWEIKDAITPHPEFLWLAEIGGVETWEMYRTFNMGCGMIIAVNSEYADKICSWLDKKMSGVKIIGNVVDNGRKVVHSQLGIEYTHY